MTLKLDKLVLSQGNYEKFIKETLEIIRKDKDIESTLKKIILFCKYAFTVNYAQRKKFLCLSLIKDISETIKSQYFQKILEERCQNIPILISQILCITV